MATGSPHVGMITATSGTVSPRSGRGVVTRLRQPLNTDRARHAAESTLAAANGNASHGSCQFRCANSHGRYTSISPISPERAVAAG